MNTKSCVKNVRPHRMSLSGGKESRCAHMCNNLERTTATQMMEKQNCREATRLRAKDLYSCRRNDGGRVINSTLRDAMASRFVGYPKALTPLRLQNS